MKTDNLKIGDEYLVLWEDTFSFAGWWWDEDIKNKSKKMQYYIQTLGFYAGIYHGFLVFAQQANFNDQNMATWGHPIWIPKGCIKKIKKLK